MYVLWGWGGLSRGSLVVLDELYMVDMVYGGGVGERDLLTWTASLSIIKTMTAIPAQYCKVAIFHSAVLKLL